MLSPPRWRQAAFVASLALGSWVLLDGTVTPSTEAAAAGEGALPSARGEDRVGNRGGSAMLFQVDASAAAAGATGGSIPVTVSRQAVVQAGQTGRLTVALPDGRRYPLRYERSESVPEGNWTFIGRVDTTLGALASVITFGRDGVFGTLPTPDGDLMKLTTRGGQVFVQPAGFSVPPGVDPSQHLDYLRPAAPAVASTAAVGATGAAPGSAAVAPMITSQSIDQDGEATITILAVYTENLSQLRGSSSAAETEYHNLVAVMNQAHIDSGTIARFEIADFVELHYPADAHNMDVRLDIEENTLPDGTDLHALREQALADLVAVIRPYVPGDLTCGISQFPGWELSGHTVSAQTGFSVTAVEACAPLVYAHEIGHNLGLMHDRETVAGPHGGSLSYGPFPFSFGHRQLGPPGFATIMAYESESRQRVGLFSHPGAPFCAGAACGDAASADNVRTVNELAGAIAAFRQPPGLLSINDEWSYEPSLDGGTLTEGYVVLSSPAPAGGVSFDIEMEGVTATLGQDIAVEPAYPLHDIVIPAGQRSATFRLRAFDDDAAEGPETIRLRLANVRGDVEVADGIATFTIIDNDAKARVAGSVRFPAGVDPPDEVYVFANAYVDGGADERMIRAVAPGFSYSVDLWEGSLVKVSAQLPGMQAQSVVIEHLDGPAQGVDLRFREEALLSGRVKSPYGQGVPGVPVILWNPRGDGAGYYANLFNGSFIAPYDMDAMAEMAMQLEVRDPPWPYVRQIVEVPPLAGPMSRDIVLRDVPSLTIPHVTVVEGAASEGDRIVLLTASLSVPGSPTGVEFDVVPVGNAGADDFHLPQTHFTIPKGRSRVEVPVVIRGDDRREGAEVVELRITNVQGAAWNPGPGSLRIATDDGRPGDGSCTGSTAGGGVIMCQ